MEKARADISAAEARTANYITFHHSRWSKTVWRKPFSQPLAESTPHLPKDWHSVAGGEGPESSLSWVFTGLTPSATTRSNAATEHVTEWHRTCLNQAAVLKTNL